MIFKKPATHCLLMVHRVQASVASTLIFLDKLPMKLNPVIRPIMDSIKKEEQTIMQVSTTHLICFSYNV